MKRGVAVIVATGISLLILVGCQSQPTVDYEREVLLAARDDAGQIPAAKDRLRHQLNVAEAQIYNSKYADARQTLTAAEGTLGSAKAGELDNRTVLAGWISLSEFYWRMYDRQDTKPPMDAKSANAALDQATTLLHAIEPESQRADFVRGVAEQMSRLRTDVEANKLLSEGAGWAAQIADTWQRRRAFRSIARDLYHNKDVAAARGALDHDPDPAWRAETLVAFTMPQYYQPRFRLPLLLRLLVGEDYYAELEAGSPAVGKVPFLRRLSSNASQSADDVSGQDDFGKPLDYESNFKGQQ